VAQDVVESRGLSVASLWPHRRNQAAGVELLGLAEVVHADIQLSPEGKEWAEATSCRRSSSLLAISRERAPLVRSIVRALETTATEHSTSGSSWIYAGEASPKTKPAPNSMPPSTGGRDGDCTTLTPTRASSSSPSSTELHRGATDDPGAWSLVAGWRRWESNPRTSCMRYGFGRISDQRQLPIGCPVIATGLEGPVEVVKLNRRSRAVQTFAASPDRVGVSIGSCPAPCLCSGRMIGTRLRKAPRHVNYA
jgi:hypothetical protein